MKNGRTLLLTSVAALSALTLVGCTAGNGQSGQSQDAGLSSTSRAYELGRELADAAWNTSHPSWVSNKATPEAWCSSWAVGPYALYAASQGVAVPQPASDIRAGCVAEANKSGYWD